MLLQQYCHTELRSSAILVATAVPATTPALGHTSIILPSLSLILLLLLLLSLLSCANATGNSPAQVAEAREADSLYCAHGSVLYPGVGLGALWGGVMVPKASASGSKDKV
jgi:hypothetical protein